MTLTTEQIEAVLTADQIAAAREIGASWGKEEASVWMDEHCEEKHIKTPPDWKNGNYSGSLDEFAALPDEDGDANDKAYAIREAAEAVIDRAAKAEWDAAMAERLEWYRIAEAEA